MVFLWFSLCFLTLTNWVIDSYSFRSNYTIETNRKCDKEKKPAPPNHFLQFGQNILQNLQVNSFSQNWWQTDEWTMFIFDKAKDKKEALPWNTRNVHEPNLSLWTQKLSFQHIYWADKLNKITVEIGSDTNEEKFNEEKIIHARVFMELPAIEKHLGKDFYSQGSVSCLFNDGTCEPYNLITDKSNNEHSLAFTIADFIAQTLNSWNFSSYKNPSNSFENLKNNTRKKLIYDWKRTEKLSATYNAKELGIQSEWTQRVQQYEFEQQKQKFKFLQFAYSNPQFNCNLIDSVEKFGWFLQLNEGAGEDKGLLYFYIKKNEQYDWIGIIKVLSSEADGNGEWFAEQASDIVKKIHQVVQDWPGSKPAWKS